MKAPEPIITEAEVTPEHTKWLHEQLKHLAHTKRIDKNSLTKAVGRILKKEARDECLHRLVCDGRATMTHVAAQRARRVEHTT